MQIFFFICGVIQKLGKKIVDLAADIETIFILQMRAVWSIYNLKQIYS